MAVTGDIDITISGGSTYNYMLAEKSGQKLWAHEPVFTQPPSMTKGFIKCTILAAPKMRQKTSGTVLTTRDIATVRAELLLLNAQTTNNLTINGHTDRGGGTWYVKMSQTPIAERIIYDITGREEQVEIDLEFIEQHT